MLAAKKPPSAVYATMIAALPIMAYTYGILNITENSLPHAANPDAVYGTKKITIKSAAIANKALLLSLYLLLKNCGIVIASPVTAV